MDNRLKLKIEWATEKYEEYNGQMIWVNNRMKQNNRLEL